jgi:hypothetical protein
VLGLGRPKGVKEVRMGLMQFQKTFKTNDTCSPLL